MLEVGKTYKDGWGKRYMVVAQSATNPEHWVVTDPEGMFRASDGRKCIFHPVRRMWRCPDSASQWDLDLRSGG